ncbi:hypothetical protein GT354_42475 [Streptomyces sp. SID3343]|nr:hypothetical protein [Streptomyces sp. SID3343]
MAGISTRTFTLAPWPWRILPWVEIPDGLTFTLFDVDPSDDMLGRRKVAGTPAEVTEWQHAHDAFLAELGRAESEVRHEHGVRTVTRFMADRTVVRRRRGDLRPGRRARSRQAFERCVARMRAADAKYQGVREVIERRLAQGADERPSDVGDRS